MDLVVDQRDHVGVLDTDENEKVMFGTGCGCGGVCMYSFHLGY